MEHGISRNGLPVTPGGSAALCSAGGPGAAMADEPDASEGNAAVSDPAPPDYPFRRLVCYARTGVVSRWLGNASPKRGDSERWGVLWPILLQNGGYVYSDRWVSRCSSKGQRAGQRLMGSVRTMCVALLALVSRIYMPCPTRLESKQGITVRDPQIYNRPNIRQKRGISFLERHATSGVCTVPPTPAAACPSSSEAASPSLRLDGRLV